MTFKRQGRTYDTSKMAVFETGNPAMPAIYVVPGGEVFVIDIDRVEGVEVRRVEREEAAVLAARHGFENLLDDANNLTSDDTSLAPSHALIVEDDGFSRHVLSRLLHLSGYESASAATVAEAETKLNENPKWLILDLHLPDGNGTVLLERIRSENLPIKVAVTTAETDEVLLSKISRLHPDAIFHKPLDMSELMHWLDAA
jgi:CheY-like chemotaxis protein